MTEGIGDGDDDPVTAPGDGRADGSEAGVADDPPGDDSDRPVQAASTAATDAAAIARNRVRREMGSRLVTPRR
jgi:hypothetical protein